MLRDVISTGGKAASESINATYIPKNCFKVNK